MADNVKQTIQRAWVEHIRTNRTQQAAEAPRCMHIKTNGARCGSPAMQRQPFCYFHGRMMNRMPVALFPPLEDANAVQCAIMHVVEELAAGRMEVKLANALLFGLQTASANLKRVRFEPARPITRLPYGERREPDPLTSEANVEEEAAG